MYPNFLINKFSSLAQTVCRRNAVFPERNKINHCYDQMQTISLMILTVFMKERKIRCL